MRIVFYTLYFCLIGQLGIAQHHFSLAFDLGKIIKHKAGLLYDIPTNSAGIRLDHKFDFETTSAAINYWGNPQLYSSFGFFDFHNKDVLGRSLYLMPGLSWTLVGSQKNQLRINFQSGLAYLNKVYDRVENPTNNAISSHINNATRIGIDYYYRIRPDLGLSFSGHILHFSNGLTVSPNSGINTLIASIALEKKITKPTNTEKLGHEEFSINRHGLSLLSALGTKQNGQQFGGPNFLVKYYRLDYVFKKNPYHHLLLGFSYEFDESRYQFELDVFTPENEAKKLATRTAAALSNEIILYRFTLRQSLGFYMPFSTNRGNEAFYIMLANDYAILRWKKLSLSAGIQLKTHFSVADYISYYALLRF